MRFFLFVFFSLFPFNSYAQWIHFDDLSSCATTVGFINNVSLNIIPLASSAWSFVSVGDPFADMHVYCSGVSVVADSFVAYLGVLPVPPPGYFLQSDIDSAVSAALALSSSSQLTFAQGAEISMAVVASCMIAVSFGLIRRSAA